MFQKCENEECPNETTVTLGIPMRLENEEGRVENGLNPIRLCSFCADDPKEYPLCVVLPLQQRQ